MSIFFIGYSIMAGILFQNPSVAALRREVNRNGQLRDMCGFKGDAAPPDWVYSRLLTKLFDYKDLINEIFNTLSNNVTIVYPALAAN